MAERVSIQVHVDGKNAVATLKEIKQYVDQLDGKKINIGAGFGSAGGSGAARGVGIRADALTKFFEYGGFSNNSARLLSILKNASKAEKEALKVEQKTLLENAHEMRRFYDNEYKQSQMDLMNTINGYANAFRTAGKVSNATSTFASGIGSAFSGMGSMFHMNIFDTARRYLTAMATRMVTGNLGASISRADIMNTFVPYMTLAGVDSATANSALNRINASILGLPIGLDEAAQRLRRYQMFMGDTEAATNMTIGIQNAIMAGGASEQMKTTAYYQIDRLLSAGKLSTSRQWLALLQGLGVSTRFLAEEMGNAGMTAKEMAAGLTSGEISTEDFLQAVQRLATNPNINRALEIYKNTYESWISNIGFAFKRGNANVLNALSDSLYASTGRTNLDYMKLFRNSVNGIYGNAVTWLGENPSAMGGLATSLLGLGGAVGGINFGGMASSILGNIGRVVDYVASGINKVSGGKLEEFVSFATTLAAPVGGVFKAVGGGLPAMLGIFDRFKDFNFEGLMDNIAVATGQMANLVSGVLGGVSDDTMSKLLSYGLVWGKPIGSLLGGIGGGIAGIGTLISGYNQGWQNIASGNWGMTGFSSFLHAKGFEDPTQFWSWVGDKAILASLPLIAGAGTAFSLYGQNLASQTAYQNMYGTDDFTGIHNIVSSANQFNYAMNNAIAGRKENYETLSDIESIQQAITQNETDMAAAYERGTELVKRRAELQKEIDTAEADRQALLVNGAIAPGMNAQYDATLQRIGRYQAELDSVNDAIKGTSNTIHELRLEGNRLNNVYDITIKKTEALTKATETGKFTIEERASYMAQIAQATEDINEATDKWIAETYGGMGRVENPAAAYYDPSYGKKSTRVDIQTTTKSLNEMGDALGTIYEYMAELPGSPEQRRQIANYVSDMLELGETDKILGFARLINTGDYDNLFGVAEDWAAKESAEGNMKTATDNLVEMSAAFQDGGEAAYMLSQNSEEVTNSLSTAGAQAEKFGHQMGEAGAAAGQAAGNVGAANSELEQTPGLASAAAGGLDTFAGSAANAAGAAGEAANYIGSVNAMLAELEGSHAIDIVVNYIQNGTPPDIFNFEGYKFLNPGSSSSSGSSGGSSNASNPIHGGGGGNSMEQFSRGGVIYAADGMFIPHGTDTVPAMLTPGEYVVRRKAAAAFGKAFMDRVNALDIHGAFRALSHRMNVPSTGSFIANNQRTYDNHASVTQNIVTNSQSFTHRRARRWVRALT